MSTPTGIEITPPELRGIIQIYRYFAQALDPIHVGTGGERLSRVDMAIVRDPATNLPKLPGTSLSGACRSYAAMRIKEGDGRFCAGQGGELQTIDGKEIKQHCSKPTCPICQTFGYAKGETGGKKGTAQFTDAHIIAFPVASALGPIWITSPSALEKIGLTASAKPEKDVYMLHNSSEKQKGVLAIGWLALEIKENGFDIQRTEVDKDSKLSSTIAQIFDGKPLALVPNNLFTQIVNDNLEVRMSVAIDPRTGAAEDGALFSYEAIPTGTLFSFDVIYQVAQQNNQQIDPKGTVEQGLQLFEWLGVGGMATRGMGRMRVL